MNALIRTSLVFGALCLGLLCALPAAADDDDDGRSPLFALQREWWQWAVSIPSGSNPLLDETGEDCGVGQHGKYWYLAGSITEKQTTRSCTVPKGVKLLVPIVVAFCYPEEGFVDDAGCIDFVNQIGSYRPENLVLQLDGRDRKIWDVCELAAAPGDGARELVDPDFAERGGFCRTEILRIEAPLEPQSVE